ncbi:hypothetical protein IVB14_27940 [Bradyrhizobium sp. 180]|uniref:hypothetical protein n=1 Tax=unclassified Bradyrhizobium TaxID=2631580 RepID=UPI001FFAAFA9|nr:MULTISPECIES: hypothetical protein [unclassified Bradyrhizobium]MCK1425687.1 hypothetical protein [Bradyrhizobium sp. CW12]MCK1494138.1 hypothetical protein [Bradyrhizobium sp. 180]MCK1532246.1 hypothetical protein [Bradyrhizobium sp. 182]MCK1594579.1 hypothetical protein [Bradyrhizobium sp. 164]MCK1618198.1 hypothetical protein [Bradyrhizobium sp. 159]
MLPDRMMRGKKGSKLQARHGVLSGFDFLFVEAARLRARGSERNRTMSRMAECAHASVFFLPHSCVQALTAGLVPATRDLCQGTKNVDAVLWRRKAIAFDHSQEIVMLGR